MALYFMHLRGGGDEIRDPEGTRFADLDTLRASVLAAARDLMRESLRNGVLDFRFRIDAEDEAGAVVYSLPFRHAVNVIPG